MALHQLNGVMKMNDILEKLKTQIDNNQTLIVATSGGPDSMALLNLLNNLKEKKHLKLICAHVNHNLRKESQEEAEMVKKYCQTQGILFEYMEINNYKGNTENFARQKRYAFFEKLIKKHKATYLLTAHHGDDLTETIIMRLIRGSSLKGYAAFQEITKKDSYQIIRPFITKTKAEILNYVKENNLPYALDQTNETDEYLRGRLRKNILPYLKEENPSVHLKFLEFSKTITETENYLADLTEEKVNKIYQNEKLNIAMFSKEKPFMQKRIINYILSNIYKENITLINDKHVLSILNLIKSQKSNNQLTFPNNKKVKKAYNYLWIEENKQSKPYHYLLDKKITLPNGDIIEIINHTNDTSNYVIKLNSKDIKMPLYIRSRQNGDKLILKGLNKSKKLKDIFIDEKIPKDQRNSWPILTDANNQIVWLPGLKKTKFDIENPQNYDIIIRYQKKGSLYE